MSEVKANGTAVEAKKSIEETYGTAIVDKDIISNAMVIRGFNQTSLAHELGYTYQSGVSSLLRGKSMSVDTFVMVLNKLGFEVQVIDTRNKQSGIKWKVAGKISKPRPPVPGAVGKKRKKPETTEGEEK